MVVLPSDLRYIVQAVSRDDGGALASSVHDTVPSCEAIPVGFALLTIQKTLKVYQLSATCGSHIFGCKYLNNEYQRYFLQKQFLLKSKSWICHEIKTC